jgi:hypothetical protein
MYHFDPKWKPLRWLNPENYQFICEEIMNDKFEIPFNENAYEIKKCASSMLANQALIELSKAANEISHDIDINIETIETMKGRVPSSYLDFLNNDLKELTKQLAHLINLFSSELNQDPYIYEMQALLEDTANLLLPDPLNDEFEKYQKVRELKRRKILKI